MGHYTSFTITRNVLPSLKQIGEVQIIKINAAQLTPAAGLLSSANRNFDINNFNFNAILQRRETVSVEGTVTYDNGFGEVFSEHLCQRLIAVFNGQNGTYSGAAFDGCDRLSGHLRDADRIEKEFKNNKR